MSNDIAGYGLWPLVVVHSAIFILFAFSFFKVAFIGIMFPRLRRDREFVRQEPSVHA